MFGRTRDKKTGFFVILRGPEDRRGIARKKVVMYDQTETVYTEEVSAERPGKAIISYLVRLHERTHNFPQVEAGIYPQIEVPIRILRTTQ